MRAEFRLPALGADMEHATLVEWRVKPGDRVSRGDVVAAVETDKGVIDLECFETGEVVGLVASPGRRVGVGDVLALLEVEGGTAQAPMAAGPGSPREKAAPPAAATVVRAPPVATARVQASPVARARARALGIALEGLAGTGAGGAIELADVEAAAKDAAPAAAPRDPAAAIRAAIGAAMARSKREIPH